MQYLSVLVNSIDTLDKYPTLQHKPLLTATSRNVATNHDEVVFQCQIFGPDENVHYNFKWETDVEKPNLPALPTSGFGDETLDEVSLSDIFGSLKEVVFGFHVR